jgi:hypothetical protein
MPDETPETDTQVTARVRKADEDRTERHRKSPLTGVLTFHDVIRHLIHHGPAQNPAQEAELAAVVDADDPSVKTPKPDPANGDKT